MSIPPRPEQGGTIISGTEALQQARANAGTNRIGKPGRETVPGMGAGLRDPLRGIHAGDIAKLSGPTGRNPDHWLVQ